MKSLKSKFLKNLFLRSNTRDYNNTEKNKATDTAAESSTAENSTQSSKIISRKTENIDLPSTEPLSEYYNQRKQLIFGEVEKSEKETFYKNLIFKSQQKINQTYSMAFSFYSKNIDLYNFILAFKESIANYCLILHLYLKEKKSKKARDIFLLMIKQNDEILKKAVNKIRLDFPKIKNNNRIAKYHPIIIKSLLQILSCLIKLAGTFNKSSHQNRFINYYLKLINISRFTANIQFISLNSDPDNDMRILSKYLYLSCLNELSLFFFCKYHPLSISIFILQEIINEYKNNNSYVFINIDKILLLKAHYNLSVFLYSEGITSDSIPNLKEAKKLLYEIKSFPLSINKKCPEFRKSQKASTSNNEENNSNNLENLSINYDQRDSLNPLNDDNYEKILNAVQKKKRTASVHVGRQQMNKISSMLSENEKNLNRICNIYIGKKKFYVKEPSHYVSDIIREKIGLQFGILLTEMELEQKNYKEAFTIANNLINFRNSSTSYFPSKERKRANKFCAFDMDNKDNNSIGKRISIHNRQNVLQNSCTINSVGRRQIMKYLENIEQQHFGEKNNNYIEESNKLLTIKNDNDILKTPLMEKNRKDAENFFIFLCGLSLYQLKILNDFQPKPSSKRDDLPILFPNQFKDCLTWAQRSKLSNLEAISIPRFMILKDSNKKITLDNIDYYFLLKNIKLNDYEEEKDNNINEIIYNYINQKETINSIDSSSIEELSESISSHKSNDYFYSYIQKKSILVNKKLYDKYVKEDKIFNKILNAITQNENRYFIYKYKKKLLYVMHQLSSDEKHLVAKSPKTFRFILNKIDNQMKEDKSRDGK